MTLVAFVSDRVRPDLVAVVSLMIAVAIGLVPGKAAFSGFADSAVITVAAVLIIGRAVELSGAASLVVRAVTPTRAPLAAKMAILLALGAVLSAFMNNIAALAIIMPVMIRLCRDENISPAVGLMPLSFATILGGMTTLIGTPANLILSSVREAELGEGFHFFDMTPVGGAVTVAGLAYLMIVGWRLAPRRDTGAEAGVEEPLRVFELHSTENLRLRWADVQTRLRGAEIAQLAVWRGHERVTLADDDILQPGDTVIVSARADPWEAGGKVDLRYDIPRSPAANAVVSRLVVADGSVLEGLSYNAVEAQTDGDLRVIAGSLRMARERKPLGAMHIQAGDQLFIQGSGDMLASYARYARLLEVDRKITAAPPARRALLVLAIYTAAVVATAAFGVSPALSFVTAAAIMTAARFVPPLDIYQSVDWPTVVLLGAMIPIGQSFDSSGAAAITASWLTEALTGVSPFWALAALTAATAVFSMFLNNVATAVVMGAVAVQAARALGADVDAFLLAVLIGASSDFLTPIGHHNNMLVMGPGGYRFSDYPRIGALMMLIVILTTAFVLSR
ncbi:MAG: SLC13/DASS family transporter [Caulobacteraceae bacterium]|nr:SLC13/DASS family transporter [Caulobacteraceae bacterium]